MKQEYDVIVIGAGLGGLVSALTLQSLGKNVLVLEQNRVAGGVATSFKRGRFEFEASLHQLGGYGSENEKGFVYQLFERLGIENKVQFSSIDEAFRVISFREKADFLLPSGIEEFLSKMEEYVPSSRESLVNLFELIDEIKNAFSYLEENEGKVLDQELQTLYPHFVEVASENANTVFKALHIPEKAILILSTYWIYLGCSISEISFLSYALLLDSLVRYKPSIPNCTSHELAVVLEQEFKNLGGEILYLTKAEEILVENNKVVGVITKNQKYNTSHVIADISPTMVYGSMIKDEDIPKEALQLQNSRVLGPRCICVYLGLNKTPKELGLKNYTYFITNTLDSDKQKKKMKDVLNGYAIVTVLNNGVMSASPSGTTELLFTGYVFSDDFNKKVNESNYFDAKEEIAKTLIQTFESATNIKIQEWIEEIEVATPATFARYTLHSDGAIGYSSLGYDNYLSRYFCEDEETFIQGLRFCGSYSTTDTTFSDVLKNGERVALKIMKEWE